jgi:hypothetical protein
LGFDSAAARLGVTPDGTKLYLATDNNTAVFDLATNAFPTILPVSSYPSGVFIQSRFAGTPGKLGCDVTSQLALAQTFGGLKAAAIALGFPTVQALQTAIDPYCGG